MYIKKCLYYENAKNKHKNVISLQNGHICMHLNFIVAGQHFIIVVNVGVGTSFFAFGFVCLSVDFVCFSSLKNSWQIGGIKSNKSWRFFYLAYFIFTGPWYKMERTILESLPDMCFEQSTFESSTFSFRVYLKYIHNEWVIFSSFIQFMSHHIIENPVLSFFISLITYFPIFLTEGNQKFSFQNTWIFSMDFLIGI